MHIDFEHIDLIDKYLLGQLTTEELKTFESLRANADFESQLALQRDLSESIQYSHDKELIQQAANEYQLANSKKKTLRWSIAASITLITLGAGIWFAQKSFYKSSKDQHHYTTNADSNLPTNKAPISASNPENVNEESQNEPSVVYSENSSGAFKKKLVKKGGETFVFDAAKGGVFVSKKSGTEINVPASAFVKENGTKVSGQVELNYKEIRSATQIALSQSPVSVKDDGQDFLINSDGIFDISAKQGGHNIKVAPDKSIEVNFVLNKGLPQIYELQLKSKKWKFWKKPTMDQTGMEQYLNNNPKEVCFTPYLKTWCGEDTLQALIDAVHKGREVAYSNETLESDPEPELDLTSFKERYQSFDYNATERFKGKNSEAYLNISLLTKKGKTKGRLEINIEDAIGLNPELKAFNKVHWIYHSSKNSDFAKDGIGKQWVDIRIKKASNSKYFLELKSLDKFVKLDVEPLIINGSGKTNKDTYLKKCLSSYRSILKKREKTFNNNLSQSYNTAKREASNEYRCFWNNNRPFMYNQELCMSPEDWSYYFNSHKSVMKNRYDSLLSRKITMLSASRMITQFNRKIQKKKRTLPCPTSGTFLGLNISKPRKRHTIRLTELGVYNLCQLYKPNGKRFNYSQTLSNFKDSKIYMVQDNGLVYQLTESKTVLSLSSRKRRFIVHNSKGLYMSSWYQNSSGMVFFEATEPDWYYND